LLAADVRVGETPATDAAAGRTLCLVHRGSRGRSGISRNTLVERLWLYGIAANFGTPR